MNNKALIFIFLAILTLTACGQNRNTISTQNENKPIANEAKKVTETQKDLKENECKICDFDFANYKGELKKEEIDGLLLALNDEYLATAIYEQVNKDFANPRPFINIVQAEMKHADTLKALFVNYKLNVPDNPWFGNAPKYTNVAEACKAGVDAEIVNRDLYTKLFKSTTREDILTVYRALQRASEENHLPAFERCGGGKGNR